MSRLARVAASVLMAFTPWVMADEIYRCGPTGSEYSQTPCPHGARIEVSDRRTEEQHAQAVALAARTEAWGDALERERLATEAAYRPAPASSLNAPTQGTSADRPHSKPKVKRKRQQAHPADAPSMGVSRPASRSGSGR
jgi:hypothetical protein